MRFALAPLIKLFAAASTAVLASCASHPPASIDVPPGQYERAFDAARDQLVRARFELDRVDARSGVITTKPKTTAGLATPWDAESVSLAQKTEDLLNQQQRRVRVTFEPTAGSMPGDGSTADLRTLEGPLTARVEVSIDRVRAPGWELDATAIRYSGRTQSRAISERGLWPRYEVPFSQDDGWARALAARVRDALAVTR